ncbi:hypothetical protein DAEQUDRAFT_814031 [Daedalea quercina L-15889]|uniref:Xylanolytic transcriptional activator regulatory domain-containing protein n=1 Tax=Daedalea quercina L-15889 TaxID=1314783 RepID=A0A165MLS5_9APHY|nr:hypothetical protein DAEQUDRAFT_814031 [Daedalea quercina L-15889]
MRVAVAAAAGGDDDEELDGSEPSGEDDELAIEVGQLSLNEDEVVRFHGKMSGLHLLGELLLELYWTYVHPALPIVCKRVFMEDFRHSQLMSADSPYSEPSKGASSPNSQSGPHAYAPALPRAARLLLAMFSIATHYSTQTGHDVAPPQECAMWVVGDRYLEDAKVILDSSYVASHPSMCQVLLLMAYCEVGIGAMVQAWLAFTDSTTANTGKRASNVLEQRRAKLVRKKRDEDVGKAREDGMATHIGTEPDTSDVVPDPVGTLADPPPELQEELLALQSVSRSGRVRRPPRALQDYLPSSTGGLPAHIPRAAPPRLPVPAPTTVPSTSVTLDAHEITPQPTSSSPEFIETKHNIFGVYRAYHPPAF